MYTNWEQGRAVSFLGIFVWNFRYSVGHMAWAIYLVLCTIVSFLLRLCSFRFLGHSMGHLSIASHSCGMAWPILLVHYIIIGLIQSIFPPQQPSTLQNASPASSHTYKILATFILHMIHNRTAFCFTSFV
jgi:hypothetical protein